MLIYFFRFSAHLPRASGMISSLFFVHFCFHGCSSFAVFCVFESEYKAFGLLGSCEIFCAPLFWSECKYFCALLFLILFAFNAARITLSDDFSIFIAVL